MSGESREAGCEKTTDDPQSPPAQTGGDREPARRPDSVQDMASLDALTVDMRLDPEKHSLLKAELKVPPQPGQLTEAASQKGGTVLDKQSLSLEGTRTVTFSAGKSYSLFWF